MTKGLFTSTEEIQFQKVYVQGKIEPEKGFSKDPKRMHQDSRRVAQNLKRLNQVKKQPFIRGR